MYNTSRVVKPLFLAIALVFGCWAFAGEEVASKPHMMYFYNPSCRLCTKSNEAVAAAEEKYKDSVSYQRFNIADKETGTDNVFYMFELMDELEVPEGNNVTLIVFLGLLGEEDGEVFFTPKRVLVEGEDIIEKLDGEIADFLETEGKGGKTLGLSRPASFFSHTALASTPAEPAPEEEKSDDSEQVAPAPGTAVPAVQPGVRPRIRPSSDGDRPRIRRTRDDGTATEATDETATGISSRAQAQLQFGALSLAALADSVNPCAFATIIILVAMMSSAKRTKREIVMVCLSFTLSVYVTYFAIGLFLHTIIAEINQQGGWFLVAADIIYYIAFLLCVVFGFLSFRDGYMIRKGRAAEEMTLQLPAAFKKRINVTMAKGVRARWLVVGVFTAGVIVSFLEAACTGQVYLPTIISLAKMSFWRSMALLAWYNLLFVLPLLIIFGMVLLGVTSQQLAEFFKKNVAWTKYALGAVFVVMGVVIWFEMYWPPGYRG